MAGRSPDGDAPSYLVPRHDRPDALFHHSLIAAIFPSLAGSYEYSRFTTMSIPMQHPPSKLIIPNSKPQEYQLPPSPVHEEVAWTTARAIQIGNIFNGVTGMKCEALIRSIRCVSLAAGRSADDAWCAEYCATRLDGAALRWYETLDMATQGSWKLLRPRLLQRWPPVDSEPEVVPLTPA